MPVDNVGEAVQRDGCSRRKRARRGVAMAYAVIRNSQFAVRNSQFAIRNSRFAIRNSRFAPRQRGPTTLQPGSPADDGTSSRRNLSVVFLRYHAPTSPVSVFWMTMSL